MRVVSFDSYGFGDDVYKSILQDFCENPELLALLPLFNFQNYLDFVERATVLELTGDCKNL